MAPLSQISARAIARLRAYIPPPTIYSTLPLSRRAAVLILLFADRCGDLKVVLTLRSSTLSSYAGQVSFPGGKADYLKETPFQTARREAFEEIGLPNNDHKVPHPFKVEHLCELPTNLAVTEMGVRPCVAYLHAEDGSRADVEETMIPKLNAKEVAAVFSAPFHKFLEEDSGWYIGSWRTWHETKWRMHNFYIPTDGETTQAQEERYRVWGLTARMVVDAARLAYAEDPEFEHNDHFGDEEIITRLNEMGKLSEKRKPGEQLSREDILKVTNGPAKM